MDQPEIIIQIVNIDVLERSTEPNCSFTVNGGSIGNSLSDHWSLYDKSSQVLAEHAFIDFIDNDFCIQQVKGNVYVNDSSYPLGEDNLALLQDNDCFEIGKFKLRVHFDHNNYFKTSPNALLEEVVGDEKQTSLLIDINANTTEKVREIENTDPEIALAETMIVVDDADPHNFFAAQDKLQDVRNELVEIIEGPGHKNHWVGSMSSVTSNEIGRRQKLATQASTINIGEGVPIVKNDFSAKLEDLEDLVMGNSDSTEGEQNEAYQTSESASLLDEAGHLAASPLQRGLEVSLKNADSTRTHDVLEEIGMTLKESIQGLLKIQGSSSDKGNGYSNKILQPIEDNPLRLGLDYQSTMGAMFNSDRSKVHLSAPMAVKESLHNIHLHQIATQHATQKALDAILQALDPSTLSKRFQRYRGANTNQSDSSEGWAWDMYKHYYAELISSRQQGFEKLYSEVFEQAYDQKLRALQNSGDSDV